MQIKIRCKTTADINNNSFIINNYPKNEYADRSKSKDIKIFTILKTKVNLFLFLFLFIGLNFFLKFITV